MEETISIQPWRTTEKVLFRIIAAYLIVYLFPFPINYISFIWEYLSEYYGMVWQVMTDWTSIHVFGLEEAAQQQYTGSGDTMYNYVTSFVNLALGLGIALIWTILDWRRPHYEKLYFYLEILVRYSLAFALITYGLIKIIKTQFPAPGPWLLSQPIGDLSPMGLAWLFMGYSPGFNLFTGLGEAIGGGLIFYRRTRLLGLFLAIAVLTNVVVMNFCYDIPVKLYSGHLLLMAILLLLRDLPKIINFFFLDQISAAQVLYQPKFFKKYKIPILLAKLAFIAYVVYPLFTNTLENQKKWGDLKPKPALYGIYEVENFYKNDTLLPPLLTDTVRWRTMIVQWEGHVNIKLTNEAVEGWKFEVDTTNQTIAMHSYRDSAAINGVFEYAQPSSEKLLLEGIWRKDTLRVEFNYRSADDFKLLQRKFHWINERPYH